jgi:hypothetical protein
MSDAPEPTAATPSKPTFAEFLLNAVPLSPQDVVGHLSRDRATSSWYNLDAPSLELYCPVCKGPRFYDAKDLSLQFTDDTCWSDLFADYDCP